MSLVVTVSLAGTPKNSVLRAYEIKSDGTIVQDVSAPTAGAGTSPTVTFATTPASTSILAIGVSAISSSGAPPTISGVSDPTNGAWTAADTGVASARNMSAVYYHLQSSGGSLVGHSNAGSAAASTACSSGTTGTTGVTSTVIAELSWTTNTVNISGLPGAFTSDAEVQSAASNGNMSEQSGHEANAASGTFTYNGTLGTAENNAGAIACFSLGGSPPPSTDGWGYIVI